MYNITLSNSAKYDINIIFNYCAERFGLNYALKIRNKIKAEINKLQYFPEANPIYSINNNTIFRKRLVNGRYIIVFQIIFNHIYILYVYDARRNINPKDLLKDK